MPTCKYCPAAPLRILRFCFATPARWALIIVAISLMPPLISPSMAALYSWKDAQGNTHYSDTPPLDKQNSRTLKSSSSAPATSPRTATPAADKRTSDKAEPISAKDKALADTEQRKNAQEEAAKAAQERAMAEEKRNSCQKARSNLAAVESGQVRFTLNAQGERVGLDGAQRTEELARLRAEANRYCN